MNLSTDITQTINSVNVRLQLLLCTPQSKLAVQSYLWQSVLGELHRVECVSFI